MSDFGCGGKGNWGIGGERKVKGGVLGKNVEGWG